MEIAEGRSQLEILHELISCVPNVQVQGIVTDLTNGSLIPNPGELPLFSWGQGRGQRAEGTRKKNLGVAYLRDELDGEGHRGMGEVMQ